MSELKEELSTSHKMNMQQPSLLEPVRWPILLFVLLTFLSLSERICHCNHNKGQLVSSLHPILW